MKFSTLTNTATKVYFKVLSFKWAVAYVPLELL